MAHVTITTTTMGFRIAVLDRGEIVGTSLTVMQYTKKFEHRQYDKIAERWVLVNEFFHFDRDQKICYFPRFDLEKFKEFLLENRVTFTVNELTPSKGEFATFLMLPHVKYKNSKQEKAVEFLTNETSGPLRGLALQTGTGKAQPLDSLIRTTDGWTKMGDVTLNTQAIMPDGTTAPVVGIYPQGEKDIYRITFEDGRFTECCDEHLWDVHYVQWRDKWKTLTLKDIRIHLEVNPTYKNRMYVPLAQSEIKEDVDLPLDPYVLGALLGDGSLSDRWVKFSSSDQFIIDQLNDLLPKHVYLRHLENYDYRISRTNEARNDTTVRESNQILNILRDLDLAGTYSHTKFIPDIYLDASPTQKLSLLQGLMDTDGTVGRENGSLSFCSVSEKLAKDVQTLVRSLGGLAKITTRYTSYTYNEEKKTGQLAYQVNIRIKNPSSVFRLPRKKELTPKNYQYADCLRLRIKHIEYVGKKEAQCIMIDHPDHLYITDEYIVTHNTVSYIWALQKLGIRSITTMTSRLEQWVKELEAYTTLDEDDIYVIQGVGSLTKLFSQIDKQIKPKIILASTKTVRLYLEYGPTYQHLPHPSEMCEKLGVGVVGTDEYHEHFYTNFLIGIMLNPALFIPITATFLANDPFVKNIFDQFVPKNIQFSGGEYEKFVNVTAYQYNSGGFYIKPFHYMSPQGYSQQMFEKFLLGRGRKVLDALIEDAIIPLIRNHYINLAEPGEKFLFLCASTKMCDYLEGVFKRVFKDKKTSVFYSGLPATILEKYDIILSTPGSSGTGRDIKNLRTCFAFENTGSETRNLQFIGRLRGPPQMMNVPEFLYLSFSCIPQHVKYANMRAMLYGPRAVQFKHRSIS